jgi:hypothetical protein
MACESFFIRSCFVFCILLNFSISSQYVNKSLFVFGGFIGIVEQNLTGV